MILTEQEVFPSSGQGPDGVLYKIVVNTEALVIHIAAQTRQQRKHITYGLPDTVVLLTAGCGLIHPLFELEDNRIEFLLMLPPQGITYNAGLCDPLKQIDIL